MKASLTLKFDVQAVARLAAHAGECRRHFPTMSNLFDKRYYAGDKLALKSSGFPDVDKLDDTKTPTGFMLMLDDGAQLISNGLPALMANKVSNEYEGVYAAGFPSGDIRGNTILRSVLGETGDRCMFVPLTWFNDALENIGDNTHIELPFPLTNVKRTSVQKVVNA